MAVASYVDDIIESSESVFRTILSTIVGRSEENAKIESIRQHSTVDKVLFDAIELILTDLNREENWLSRLLYKYLNIELKKNKKHMQLIILGGQLKTQYHTVVKERQRVDFYLKTLENSIVNLRELSSAIHNRRPVLRTRAKRNRSLALIKKIQSRVDTLLQYQEPLQQKLKRLGETEHQYRDLYHRIPRYYELQEETYLNLLAYSA